MGRNPEENESGTRCTAGESVWVLARRVVVLLPTWRSILPVIGVFLAGSDLPPMDPCGWPQPGASGALPERHLGGWWAHQNSGAVATAGPDRLGAIAQHRNVGLLV